MHGNYHAFPQETFNLGDGDLNADCEWAWTYEPLPVRAMLTKIRDIWD